MPADSLLTPQERLTSAYHLTRGYMRWSITHRRYAAVSLLQGLLVGFLALVVVTGASAQDVPEPAAVMAPGFMETIPAWVWAVVVLIITFLANAWQLAVLRRADTVKDSLEAVGKRLETQFGNMQVAHGTIAKEQAIHGVQIEGLNKRVDRLEEV